MTHPPATCELCGGTGLYSPSALPCPKECKDIVERLRSYAKDQGGWHNIDDTCEEAADLIECLRQSLSEAEKREREARSKALEEAAKVAEGKARDFNFQQALADYDDLAVGENGVRIEIADNIRALKDEVR